MMMKTFRQQLFVILVWLGIPVLVLAQHQEISEDRLYEVVSYLASDAMQGRRPGSSGDIQSANFILDHFRQAGLNTEPPMGLQAFDVVTGADPGQGNRLVFDEQHLVYGTDFVTLSFSSNASVNAGLVFAGYGMKIKNDTLLWDDWDGLEVEGKWVLLLRGRPDPDNPNSPFEANTSERDKVLIAKDHGAAGVIFVNGPTFLAKDALMDMFFDRSSATAGIPVFQVSRDAVVRMIEKPGFVLEEIEQQIMRNQHPASFAMDTWVEGSTEVILNRTRTYNVMGLLPGTDPVLKDEYVLVGAHFDHLGMGGRGSGSRRPDSLAVHPGADDNASGVAGVIELAHQFSRMGALKRSVIFVAFGAEEMGLLGSRYFVENPVLPLQQVLAMVNFDMIGRLNEDRSLLIGGTGTAIETEDLLRAVGEDHRIKFSFSPEGFGASDHAAFYAKDIPVFFISTGAHDDYHTPDDVTEKINFAGQADVLRFSKDLLIELSNRENKLTFQESGPKSRPRHGRGYKVTLGIMPDFAGTGNDGLRVDAVRPEGPAGLGGMKKGDIITAVEGLKVNSIYDYMARLKTLENGQTITVDVMRDGKSMVLMIQI